MPENGFYYWQDRQQTPPKQLEPYFNSGILVLTPDTAVLSELKQYIAAIMDFARYPFPEQDLLNEYFHGRWLALSWRYNALKTLPVQHPQSWRFDEVKIIHYILNTPWQRDWQQAEAERDPYYVLDRLWLETAQQAEQARK